MRPKCFERLVCRTKPLCLLELLSRYFIWRNTYCSAISGRKADERPLVAVHNMTAPATVSKKAILTPWIDGLLAGGLSLIVLGLFALTSLTVSSELVLQKFLVLTVAINGVHFMASYRLLYSSRTFARSYSWASIYVPVGLILYGLGALGLCVYEPTWRMPVDALLVIASLYLALHYTGQAWGMMASFAYLEGIKFEAYEKQIFRFLLKVLATWHVVWALRLLPRIVERFGALLSVASSVMNVCAVITLVVGLGCLWRIGRRHQRIIPGRIVVPFFSLHVWYAFLYVFPQSLFWVQIFHALQYMPFPLRVELNRTQAGTKELPEVESRRHSVAYLSVLCFTSAIVFAGIPWATGGEGTGAGSVWVVLASIINIHHYFIDGCIWRISNPVVSQELFAHTRNA